MVEQKRRDVAERLFVSDALARACRHFLTAGRQVLLERLGVARELGPQLLDLATEIPRLRVLRYRPLLVLLELLALRLDEGRGCARPLEDSPHLRRGAGCMVGGLLRLHLRALGLLQGIAQSSHFHLLGRLLAQRARLLVGELFDLASYL